VIHVADDKKHLKETRVIELELLNHLNLLNEKLDDYFCLPSITMIDVHKPGSHAPVTGQSGILNEARTFKSRSNESPESGRRF
jgi:hypothetical protein